MKRNLRSMTELKELLKNPSPNLKVPVYTENKGGHKPVIKTDKYSTLSNRVGALETRVSALETRFDHLDARIERLEMSITNLTKIVRDGFKHIDTRLDYIVKANDLKDMPNKAR